MEPMPEGAKNFFIGLAIVFPLVWFVLWLIEKFWIWWLYQPWWLKIICFPGFIIHILVIMGAAGSANRFRDWWNK